MMRIPTPDATMLAHSEQLRQLICHEIDEHGPITFARYMQRALYEPGLGYYRSSAAKFGAAGDFTTAPEISPLFAICLAKRCAMLFAMGYENVWEIGAGSGVLAVDILLALERFGCLPRHYYILELSGELMARQKQLIRQRIGHLYERVVWLDTWPQQKFNGVVIANELFDAMPVHRFMIEDGIKEYYVKHEQGVLQWQCALPSTPHLITQLEGYGISFAQGYSSEINLMLPAWIRSLCEVIDHAHMIFIDYGYKREVYYHPERSMGTLMCHLQHCAHDNPLLYPGIQDITAHVDFTLLAQAAVDHGCHVVGLNNQAQYLIMQGIADCIADEPDKTKQISLAQHVKQLIMPNQMGEVFKVLELERF